MLSQPIPFPLRHIRACLHALLPPPLACVVTADSCEKVADLRNIDKSQTKTATCTPNKLWRWHGPKRRRSEGGICSDCFPLVTARSHLSKAIFEGILISPTWRVGVDQGVLVGAIALGRGTGFFITKPMNSDNSRCHEPMCYSTPINSTCSALQWPGAPMRKLHPASTHPPTQP